MRAEFTELYGHTWRTQTRPRILTRAGHECERCAAPDRPMNARNSTLEIAHLDGRPKPAAEEQDENLACLCHRCHRQHDYKAWHIQFAAYLHRRREARIDAADASRPILEFLRRGMAMQREIDDILESA